LGENGSGSLKQKILLGVAVIIFVAAGVLVWRNLSGDPRVRSASERMFKCAETGEVFEYKIQIGDIEPVYSPASKKNTAYAAETCYWGKDASGQWYVKDEPDYVILNLKLNPGSYEKTYCPVCKREVVQHNRRPSQQDIDRANNLSRGDEDHRE
jgi:hypothetical protein